MSSVGGGGTQPATRVVLLIQVKSAAAPRTSRACTLPGTIEAVTITAAYHFDVHDLWIESELLGSRLERTIDGRRCWIEVPLDETSFGLGAKGTPSAIGGYSGTVDSPRQRLAVEILRVTVEIDSDITADEVLASGPDDNFARLEECSALLKDAAEIARRAFSELVAFVRTSGGQYWLEPLYKSPQVSWMTDVRDGRGERVPTGYHDGMTVYARSNVGLSRATLHALNDKAERRERPSLADELLADAAFYSSPESQPNPRIAILFAAIAAEVRIKTFLADQATPCAIGTRHTPIREPARRLHGSRFALRQGAACGRRALSP